MMPTKKKDNILVQKSTAWEVWCPMIDVDCLADHIATVKS